MTPSQSRVLEERLSGLISQLAVTNESLMNIARMAEKHENLLYGKDDDGGMVSRSNVNRKTLEEHATILDRLENSCNEVTKFMETQGETNKAISSSIANVNRVILGLGGVVFLILLLIGVADITALHNLLAGIHLP